MRLPLIAIRGLLEVIKCIARAVKHFINLEKQKSGQIQRLLFLFTTINLKRNSLDCQDFLMAGLAGTSSDSRKPHSAIIGRWEQAFMTSNKKTPAGNKIN